MHWVGHRVGRQAIWPAEEAPLGWLEQCSGLGSKMPGTSTVHCPGHACLCSQRLETLQQSCQVLCALLQGAIESMKAVPQPMESGVSVSFQHLPQCSLFSSSSPMHTSTACCP